MGVDATSSFRLREVAGDALLVLVSLSFALAGVEVLFRVTDAETRLFPYLAISDNALTTVCLSEEFPELSTVILNNASSTVTYVYPDDPRGYFGQGGVVESRINSLGFRGREFERRKGNNVFRIAFLGDSCTLGQGVHFEDTYPEVVSAELNRRRVESGTRFESYNFGVPGGNLVNSLNVFVTFVTSCSPDMVVLGLTLNDMEPNIIAYENAGGRLVPVRYPRALDRFEGAGGPMKQGTGGTFAVGRVLRKAALAIRRPAKTVEHYVSLYGRENSGWREINLQALESIAQRCARRRIPFRVIILPVFYRLEEYPFGEIHAFLREFLEARQIEHIDMLEPFRGMRHEDFWVHRVDPHPNEKAHALIGRYAADWLVEPVLHEPAASR